MTHLKTLGATTILLILSLISFVFPAAPGVTAQPASANSAMGPSVAVLDKSPVLSETITMKLGNRKVAVNLVRVKLADSRVEVRVGLGQDRVGGTEELLGLARRKGAIVAITGTFFEAYTNGETKDPLGTLITGGKLVHIGDTGTVFAITATKEVRMEPVRFRIIGATDGSYGWPHDWYAYWINHAPASPTSDHAVIYTPARGDTTGAVGGASVVVQGGRVTRSGSGEQAIPKDGYVLNFQGSDLHLASRFQLGTTVEYLVTFQDGSPLSKFWADAQEGLGAGPKLVADGKVVYSTESAKAEGFTDPRILSSSCERSALGLNARGDLLMVTVTSATMNELARVMQSLGVVEAMNLDGGASSGLVYNGNYITRPGRKISNALLVVLSN